MGTGIWLLLVLAAEPSAGAAKTQPPACVDVRGEARYRNYGYDHLVVVRNGCDRPVTCDVSTNVNPEPTRVELPSGTSTELLTFRGSPAREFTPRAECRFSS